MGTFFKYGTYRIGEFGCDLLVPCPAVRSMLVVTLPALLLCAYKASVLTCLSLLAGLTSTQ